MRFARRRVKPPDCDTGPERSPAASPIHRRCRTASIEFPPRAATIRLLVEHPRGLAHAVEIALGHLPRHASTGRRHENLRASLRACASAAELLLGAHAGGASSVLAVKAIQFPSGDHAIERGRISPPMVTSAPVSTLRT